LIKQEDGTKKSEKNGEKIIVKCFAWQGGGDADSSALSLARRVLPKQFSGFFYFSHFLAVL